MTAATQQREDLRALGELRALFRLGAATRNAEFEQRCADELMVGVFRLLRQEPDDIRQDTKERSGTAREAPSTGMRAGTATEAVHTPPETSVGAQPAAPPQMQSRANAGEPAPPRTTGDAGDDPASRLATRRSVCPQPPEATEGKPGPNAREEGGSPSRTAGNRAPCTLSPLEQALADYARRGKSVAPLGGGLWLVDGKRRSEIGLISEWEDRQKRHARANRAAAA